MAAEKEVDAPHALPYDFRQNAEQLTITDNPRVADALKRAREADAEDALALYDRLIELDPRCEEAHSRRAILLVRKGRFIDALIAARQAVALAPGSIRAHKARSEVEVRTAISSFDDSFDDLAVAQLRRIEDLSHQNNYYQLAVALAVDICRIRANEIAKLGHTEEAFNELSKITELFCKYNQDTENEIDIRTFFERGRRLKKLLYIHKHKENNLNIESIESYIERLYDLSTMDNQEHLLSLFKESGLTFAQLKTAITSFKAENAPAVPQDKAMTQGGVAAPTWPSEKWETSSENTGVGARKAHKIIAYMRRVWKPFIEETGAVVTRDILKIKDREAESALTRYLERHPMPKDLLILYPEELKEISADRPTLFRSDIPTTHRSIA